MNNLQRFAVLLFVGILALLPEPSSTSSVAATPPVSGFRTLAGAEARAFALPGDVRLLRTLPLDAYGLTYERYQQTFGPAAVLGGQLTVYRNTAGEAVSVIGAHFPSITPANAVGLGHADAARVAEREIGPADARTVDLLIDPASGIFFFRVESSGFGKRWVHWIEAGSGRVLNSYDAIASDHGFGVKGDTKDLNGPDNTAPADDLTTFHNSSGHGDPTSPHWDLFSNDNRQWTYSAHNGTLIAYTVTDRDNHWTVVGSAWPDGTALSDAQFYANVTDDYYLGRHGFNFLTCETRMSSVAHYASNYNNAFWDGTFVIYGNGDGVVFTKLSGGLDVVAHEFTHGVTDCTSSLDYLNESGALNESFSDILGNSAEFFAAEPLSTNCKLAAGQGACADWWIGEDIYLPADATPGFRNMANPPEDGDPDHYSERQVGGGDNGGVHTNSGISNHAYYLLVNGGQNAGCTLAVPHAHCPADGGISVGGLGLTQAERIFFTGFIALPATATMCNARSATENQAQVLYGAPARASTADAWRAVGLTDALCGLGAPAPAAPTNLTANDHPGDAGGAIDLTWTPSASGGVTQQRLYRSTTSGGPYALVATFNGNATALHTDSGLTNGTPYFYVVRAFDGTSESGNSNQASATPADNLPPLAPTNLAAVDRPADSGGAINLTWVPSTSGDVTQQRLYRSTTSGGPYTLVATFNDNTTGSHTDTGLTNGTPYFYVVRAFDGTSESGNSNQASATPANNLGPAPPTGLTAADRPLDEGGAIDLGWTPSASGGVTQQRLYRGTVSGGPYALVATFNDNTTTSHTDVGLANGTPCFYVVRAFDGTSESGNSNQASATPIDNLAPLAPTNLAAVDRPADSGSAINLTWTPSTSSDVTQQRLLRSTTAGGPYSPVVTFFNNTTGAYTDTGLTNGTTYFYVLRAFDGTNESTNSNQASAAPIANVLGTVTVNGISPTSMKQGTSISAVISGTGFAVGAAVTFEDGECGPLPAAVVTGVSATAINVTISTPSSSAVPSRGCRWDVRVTNLDGSTGELVRGFRVRR